MPRTSPDLVKAILGGNYGDGTLLDPYIEAASTIVDDLVYYAQQRGQTLSGTKLELVERWISCWCYCQMDPLYTSRSTLSASGSFAEQDYKKVAVAMDPTGVLSALLEGRRAGMSWLGKYPSAQTPYEEKR